MKNAKEKNQRTLMKTLRGGRGAGQSRLIGHVMRRGDTDMENNVTTGRGRQDRKR